MKLALNTMLIKDAPLERKISAVAAAGFEGIELWIEDFERDPQGARALLDDTGLVPFSVEKLAGWFEGDGALMGTSDDPRAILAECRRRMELAAAIGARYIICCPSFSHRGYSAPLELGAERFRELLRLGREIGVMPTIEFMGQTAQVRTIAGCLEFLEAVGDPEARMVVDAYHLWKGEGSVEGLRMAEPRLISLLHASDCDPSIPREEHRDRDRLLPGDGRIDLRAFGRIAGEIGFDGYVSIGVYNQSYAAEDPAALCARVARKSSLALGLTC